MKDETATDKRSEGQHNTPRGELPAAVIARALRKNIRAAERTALSAAEFCERSRFTPGELEWLLDNRYLCRQIGRASCRERV